MSHRYAVLWESAPDQRARPVGLVVEQDDRVVVEVRDDLCVPRAYEAPFQVLGPDLTPVIYRPGDRQYFDQVVMDLSRTFTVGKEGRVNNASNGVILGLLSQHVWPLLRRDHVAVYWEKARTYPAVRAYQDQFYRGAGPAAESTDAKPAAVRASSGSYVAA